MAREDVSYFPPEARCTVPGCPFPRHAEAGTFCALHYEMRERLAAYAHDAWIGWMKYLFDKSDLNGDNSVTIPAWAVERWTRQMRHTYEALPEEEKASDRAEADKMLAIMRGPRG